MTLKFIAVAGLTSSMAFLASCGKDDDNDRPVIGELQEERVFEIVEAQADNAKNETKFIARFTELTENGDVRRLDAGSKVQLDGSPMTFSEDPAECGKAPCYFVKLPSVDPARVHAFQYIEDDGETHKLDVKVLPGASLRLTADQLVMNRNEQVAIEWAGFTPEDREEIWLQLSSGDKKVDVNLTHEEAKAGKKMVQPDQFKELPAGVGVITLVRQKEEAISRESAPLAGGELRRKTMSATIPTLIKD